MMKKTSLVLIMFALTSMQLNAASVADLPLTSLEPTSKFSFTFDLKFPAENHRIDLQDMSKGEIACFADLDGAQRNKTYVLEAGDPVFVKQISSNQNMSTFEAYGPYAGHRVTFHLVSALIPSVEMLLTCFKKGDDMYASREKISDLSAALSNKIRITLGSSAELRL